MLDPTAASTLLQPILIAVEAYKSRLLGSKSKDHAKRTFDSFLKLIDDIKKISGDITTTQKLIDVYKATPPTDDAEKIKFTEMITNIADLQNEKTRFLGEMNRQVDEFMKDYPENQYARYREPLKSLRDEVNKNNFPTAPRAPVEFGLKSRTPKTEFFSPIPKNIYDELKAIHSDEAKIMEELNKILTAGDYKGNPLSDNDQLVIAHHLHHNKYSGAGFASMSKNMVGFLQRKKVSRIEKDIDPEDYDYLQMCKEAYKYDRRDVDEYEYELRISDKGMTVYEKDNVIVIAYRGTQEIEDLMTDVYVLKNKLLDSDRYKDD